MEYFENIESTLDDILKIKESCFVWVEWFDWNEIWICVSFEREIWWFPQEIKAKFFLLGIKKEYMKYYNIDKEDQEEINFRQIKWCKNPQEAIQLAKDFMTTN